MTYHAYERISKDPNNLSEAIERQAADNNKLAKQLGWAPLEHLPERNASAWRKAGSRPVFNHLLDLINTEQTEGVIVWNMDRLLRRVDELEVLIKAIVAHPVPIHSPHGQINLNDDDGQMMARFLITIAQKSSADTSRRIKRAMQDAPPRQRSFAHQPENHAIVEWMVASLIDGATYSWVANTMNEDGLVTIQGNPWSVTTVGRLMRNKKLIDIVGQERFIELQKTCESRAVNKGRTTQSNHPYPLTGIVTCAVCQGQMIGSGSLRPDGYRPRYRCRGGLSGDCWNGIDAANLETLVKSRIRLRLTSQVLSRPVVTEVDPEIADQIATLDHAFFVEKSIDKARYDAVNKSLTELMVKSAKTVEKVLTLKEFDSFTDDDLRVRYQTMAVKVTVGPVNGTRWFDPERVSIQAGFQD